MRYLALLMALGCGSVPTLNTCHLAAVHKLPLTNPDAISVADVKSLAADLKACGAHADAGAP